MFEGKNIHFSPLDNKPLCSYSNKLCRQRRLNGYAFCIRHILEDKSAPFKQCSFVTKNNSQKCLNAIPSGQDRGYCHSHMQVVGMLPKPARKPPKKSSVPECKKESLQSALTASTNKNNKSKPQNGTKELKLPPALLPLKKGKKDGRNCSSASPTSISEEEQKNKMALLGNHKVQNRSSSKKKKAPSQPNGVKKKPSLVPARSDPPTICVRERWRNFKFAPEGEKPQLAELKTLNVLKKLPLFEGQEDSPSKERSIGSLGSLFTPPVLAKKRVRKEGFLLRRVEVVKEEPPQLQLLQREDQVETRQEFLARVRSAFKAQYKTIRKAVSWSEKEDRIANRAFRQSLLLAVSTDLNSSAQALLSSDPRFDSPPKKSIPLTPNSEIKNKLKPDNISWNGNVRRKPKVNGVDEKKLEKKKDNKETEKMINSRINGNVGKKRRLENGISLGLEGLAVDMGKREFPQPGLHSISASSVTDLHSSGVFDSVLNSVGSSSAGATPEDATDASFDSPFDNSTSSQPDCEFSDEDLEKSFELALDPELAVQASRLLEENELTEDDFNELFPDTRMGDKLGRSTDLSDLGIDFSTNFDANDIDYSLFANIFPNFRSSQPESISVTNQF